MLKFYKGKDNCSKLTGKLILIYFTLLHKVLSLKHLCGCVQFRYEL